MSPKTMPAVYICGGYEQLKTRPCPKGGAEHTPFPIGYVADHEYAAQLLNTGWTQHRCPDCGLWGNWTPDQPQPQPPMRDNPDDDHGLWEIPDDAEPCDWCNDGTATAPDTLT